MPIKTELIQKELDHAVEKEIFPGASLLVARDNDILCLAHAGKTSTNSDAQDISDNTLFDIASLTKPMATATLMMMTNQEVENLIDQPIGDFFHSAFYGEVAIKYLLNHSSGLLAWKDYYKNFTPETPDHDQGTQKILKLTAKETPHSKEGVKCVYSDLGYIILGYILEQIYAKSLDAIFEEKIAKPFGLTSTAYRPLPLSGNMNQETIASTEDCPWRKKTLSGEVDDEHAWLMAGVAGHAGLFSTATDIHKWIVELIKARVGTSSLLDQKNFELFTHVPAKRDRLKRYFTLGFDTPSEPSSSGKNFSSQSLGHLGFTGTSFWWDTTNDAMVILLTNRVHPSRNNEKIKAFRPHLHDLIWKTYFA